MIPDFRIRGRAVSAAELDSAPALPPAAFLAVPDASRPAASGKNPLETRDKMVAHLVSTGEHHTTARHHADTAAIKHDRRRG